MGIEEVNRIRAIFTELGIEPEYLEHEPVLTSQEASDLRGFSLKQGIKALLFTCKDEWVIVDVPADFRVDQKKVAEKLGWSKGKTRMATPQQVEEKTGCLIGAVPPFCHREKIQILVDKRVFENERSAFNIGLRTHSVKIKTELMKKVFEHEHATIGEFSK